MEIYIRLDDYLAQWFIHEQGGSVPVLLKRGSVESKILEVYLCRRPHSLTPDCGGEHTVAITIPCFRNRPPEVYNHLPESARKALAGVIRERFDIALWRDLHVFGKIRRRQDELIYAWMEANGIEMTETNWNAVAKRYQRLRNVYRKRDWAKEKYNGKKSD